MHVKRNDLNAKSRMKGDFHVRFRERLRVKFPWSTRQRTIRKLTTQRLMKPICLGRKNYLFCGSEQAAKNTSLIYSIIESCKMNGLRPVKYIADVLRKLISGDTDYVALLPMNIAK